MTASFIDETEVEGRDADKEILVSKLLGENSSQNDKGIQIIPIVGMGGLGKTTLAQLAYKDEKVKAHFDLRIWVCVSDPFEEIKVAKAIIEAVEGKSPDINELECLLQRVMKCIEGKRFLLILDDVWTKDSKKWNPLKEALKCGTVGSRVIVFTRKEEVSKMMGATKNMIMLEKLSVGSRVIVFTRKEGVSKMRHCWLVFEFERIAFLERSEEERKELEEIGRQIANKCKGLPLPAKSLGGLMCFKKTKSQWDNVLHSEMWRLENVNETFASFLLSYYDLSSKERRCFSYCSIFPKDYRIEREALFLLLFPKLKKLIFYSMPQWEKWEGINTAATENNLITIMPCLHTLSFYLCPRLKLLPDFLKMTASLRQLNFRGSDMMQKWCREKTGDEWDKISHIPNIRQ